MNLYQKKATYPLLETQARSQHSRIALVSLSNCPPMNVAWDSESLGA